MTFGRVRRQFAWTLGHLNPMAEERRRLSFCNVRFAQRPSDNSRQNGRYPAKNGQQMHATKRG